VALSFDLSLRTDVLVAAASFMVGPNGRPKSTTTERATLRVGDAQTFRRLVQTLAQLPHPVLIGPKELSDP